MRKMRREGQSILEYTLLLGAIIAVIVAVLLGGQSSMKGKVEDTYDAFGNAISNTANDADIGVLTP
ncbi:MAG: Flp family type IVb pilin [Candidatus Omnitrophota bacterium]